MVDESIVKTSAELIPGLFKGVDYDEYAEWPAVNAHTLNGFSRTPAHVQYERLHGGKKRTPALDLGWLVHLAVLEPDRFEAEVVVPPKVDKRTVGGKKAWAEFEASNPDKMYVDEETHRKVGLMVDSLHKHETAEEFFYTNPGQSELSVLWKDITSGVMCKGRIDRVGSIGEWPIVADLKTARNAARWSFERTIHTYGYHVQAAHYLDGLQTLYPLESGDPFRRFVFFVVESEPPYCCAALELDDLAIEEGAIARRKYINQWQECTKSGVWMGYPPGIDYVSLPAWAFKNFVE